jgi:hypothetical protein
LAQVPLNRKAAAILKTVFVSAVLPQLAISELAKAPGKSPRPHPRVTELAELLVATDQGAALELISELQGSDELVAPLFATLFEPAARSLGDLWNEDVCSEFDVSLGLLRLQTAIRLLTTGTFVGRPSRLPQPVVLIAPEPGELHRLGAALDTSVLQNAGWSPQCEYPSDDAALQDLLAANWFDVLDLSLSVAFRRDHLLPRLAETITQARRASRNPGLVVVVGGRVFLEQQSAGRLVGADHANTTASNVNRSILRTMGGTRTGSVAAARQVQVLVTPS